MWTAVLFLAATMAPAAGPFRCEAREIAGLPAADAATAVAIACEELASVSRHTGAYGVSVRSLGESVVMTVSHAGAADGRSLVLDGLKEVPMAARRLAEAVVLGKPIEDTRLVDNLVESEGRELVTLPGSFKFELGALGLAAGRSTGTGAGFSLALAYDSPTFAIPAELRFAHSSSGDRETSVFSIDTERATSSHAATPAPSSAVGCRCSFSPCPICATRTVTSSWKTVTGVPASTRKRGSRSSACTAAA